MKNLSQKLTKYYKPILFVIFLIAVTLRWWYLPQFAISFAYDQARDAFVVSEILGGHLKILGPSVSGVPGLFHGVFYYYVIAPAYLLGHGNPVAVAYFLSFISSLGVFVVYWLTHLLTKDKIPALISALIFAFSFEASQYANLLTNASMGVWFVPLIYIGLYLWTRSTSSGRLWAPLLTGFAFGLSVQSEIALAYHLVPIIIWLVVYKSKIIKREIFLAIIALFVATSTMIISEIKFGFTGTSGILYLLSGKDGITQTKELSDFIITVLNQSGKTFAYTIFPLSLIFGSALGFIFTVIVLRTKTFWSKYLISYIFAYIFALPFGGWNMKHILVGVAPAVSILTGIFIWNYFKNSKILLVSTLIIILLANLVMIIKENKYGQTIFPLQRDLTLSNELKLIDFTYNKSSDEFSISSLTSPLFVNTLWSYLYNWYGYDKYGHLPYWIGRDQVGQLGDNLIFATSKIDKHFFIIEPTYGIPDLWVTYAKGDQDAVSTMVDRKKFGELVVEERRMKK